MNKITSINVEVYIEWKEVNILMKNTGIDELGIVINTRTADGLRTVVGSASKLIEEEFKKTDLFKIALHTIEHTRAKKLKI